jgi:glyoxylase-like metal-dependent hydrolase (beta-lactamase superfamily II)
MNTSRRAFFQNAGAGVAGLGIAAARSASATAFQHGEGTAIGPHGKEMWPIVSDIKSTRIKFDTPQNQISHAYMKQVRENNRTKKIYPVNPYVEVYQFRDNAYELFTMNCDGKGDMWMHLIVGPEKAMLIDTGYGLGDIPGLVNKLTAGKPLIVANTHDHPDHAKGNCRFDRVYCHEHSAASLEAQDEHIWDYLFDKDGKNIWLQFDRKDLPKFKKYEVVGVPDGHVFNLGKGYEVELIHTGGHAVGHAGYLDKTNRIFYPGDNICSDISGCGNITVTSKAPHAETTALAFYRDRMKKLVERINEYDYVFPNHFMTNVENSLMYNILETCEKIIENPKSYDYKAFYPGNNGGMTRCYKYIPGFSVLAYQYAEA